MPSAKFEPAIPANKRLQTYTLDGTTTEIGQMPSLFVAQLRSETTLLYSVLPHPFHTDVIL